MVSYYREKIPLYRSVAVYLYTVLLIAISSGMIAYTSTLKYIYQAGFPLQQNAVMLMVSLYIVFYYISQIPAGIIIDRTSINTGVAISLSSYIVGLLLFAISHGLVMFTIARIIIAFGAGFSYVLAVLVARELFVNKWFTMLIGFAELAFALSIALTPYVFKVFSFYLTWRFASMLVAFFLVLSLIIFCFIKLPTHAAIHDDNTFKEKNIFLHIKAIIGSYTFWFLAITMGVFYTHFTVFTEINGAAYIQKVYGDSYIQSIDLNNIALTGYMVGCLLLGLVERILKPRRAFFLAALVSTLFFAIIAFDHHLLDHSKVIRPIIYFVLGFFAPYILLVFRLYQMFTGRSLNATANACIMLVVCLTPLVLMNFYKALWQISFADTRYFLFSCYALATLLALGLFCYKRHYSES